MCVLPVSVLAAASLQVLALLASKYLSCWDVRYYTLQTLTRLAQRRAVRGSSTGGSAPPTSAAAAAAEDGSVPDEGEDIDETAASGQQQQQQLPKDIADIARTMFDVLAQVQPVAAKQQQQQRHGDESDDDVDGAAVAAGAGAVQSWCGAAEVSRRACMVVMRGNRQELYMQPCVLDLVVRSVWLSTWYRSVCKATGPHKQIAWAGGTRGKEGAGCWCGWKLVGRGCMLRSFCDTAAQQRWK